MNWRYFSCLVFFNWVAVLAGDPVHLDPIQRRMGRRQKSLYIFAVPHLPLMKDSSLESAAKDIPGRPVYGNLNNLGITHGKTSNRLKYSGFRRNSFTLKNLLNSYNKKSKATQQRKYLPTIILIKNIGLPRIKEIKEPSTDHETRRRRIKHKHRKELYETDESDVSSSSSSSEFEKNPGNPFTIHKNRYKQNWMWNHAMTGDHVNINPKAPLFNNMGPTGPELFFGRKWWYFNQDDYVPFR